jgi:hypothetical protein
VLEAGVRNRGVAIAARPAIEVPRKTAIASGRYHAPFDAMAVAR